MSVRVVDLPEGARFHVPRSGAPPRNFTRADHAVEQGVVYAVRHWPKEHEVYTGPYKLHGARERFAPHVMVEEGWVTT